VNDGDFSVFERLLSVVSVPYEDQPANEPIRRDPIRSCMKRFAAPDLSGLFRWR
jgi:hypothetical protein